MYALPQKRSWIELREIDSEGLQLCVIEARPNLKLGGWEFWRRRAWQETWFPLATDEDLTEKPTCPIREFETRFPQCILNRHPGGRLPI